MKKLELKNDDFLGYVKHLRHACRGIVVHESKVLLGYEEKNNKYIIPGGGLEEGETYEQCCERELLEETGMQVRAKEEYLEIGELFLDWNHINHYFVCELIKDTGSINLTKTEKEAGCTFKWLTMEEALNIFGRYEDYPKTNIADFGLYRREYFALKEYKAHVR
ncbi:MAG: NUDIX hydrolase [Treponema sp.]|nr:NUDIX hydrolase [Treponema sp.]